MSTKLQLAKALLEMNIDDPNQWAIDLVAKADNGPRFNQLYTLAYDFLEGVHDSREYVTQTIELLMATSFDPEGIEPILQFASALSALAPKKPDDEEDDEAEDEAGEDEAAEAEDEAEDEEVEPDVVEAIAPPPPPPKVIPVSTKANILGGLKAFRR